MEIVVEKKYTIEQLRDMLRKAKTLEEIQSIKNYFPKLSKQELLDGHKCLDDGLYNEQGTLIGEKHPDD